ncbi:DUF2207 domain-containing protein [Luteimonas salinilitoris]|uniref:DUF2207 domain-containing protein n=1 Tax=Luteimonas salinilitoris TaxID=3237697 RepID=A0ABV4HVZ3_9GAMM
MTRLLTLLALIAAFACAMPLAAQDTEAASAPGERILAYDSEVEVHEDGGMEITERIRVRAEGNDIRRGIYRDFPTRYRDRAGNRVVVDFEVLDVLRDGTPEPWFTERRANGVRVNTGNDDFLPVPAVYTYTLRYRTSRQLGFFDDHDELYWNAIGHGWAFTIDTGSVEVRLPQPVAEADMTIAGYTGPQGARGQDVRGTLPAPGVARWELTRPLAPNEGMTIVLEFPKGIVAAPSRAQRLLWLLNDNRGLLLGLAGLLALLAYCIVRWRRIGRDPAAGTIIVRYEPPTGYSPAGLRYMKRMRHDSRAFTADLLACAVDGAVVIHRDKGLLSDSWRVERVADLEQAAAPERTALLQQLLPRAGASLEMRNSNASTFQAAMRKHATLLKKRFQPAMFEHNGGSIAIAALIMGVSLALAFALGVGTGSGVLLLIPVAAAMLVTVIVFAIVIAAPTMEGRRLLDEIEGFRRYLKVAEQQDLERLQAPGEAEPRLDAARFERLLPYAVALDVEDAWTKKFTLAVGAAAAAATTASIAWYRGGGVSDLGSLTKAVGSSLSSQIASSSTPPGSSSGGGGGGFSGGGGGGGGGGGR